MTKRIPTPPLTPNHTRTQRADPMLHHAPQHAGGGPRPVQGTATERRGAEERGGKGGGKEVGHEGDDLLPLTDEVPPYVRRQFLRKVYGLVALQLLLTTSVAASFVVAPPLRSVATGTDAAPMGAAASAGALALVVVLACARPPYPWNAVAWWSLGVLEGVAFGPLAASMHAAGRGAVVWSSAVAAGGTFAVLSAVTLAREGGEKGGGGGAHSDARWSGTIAAACLFGAAAAGVGGWAMGAGGPSVVVSSLGVAGFCALVVHDTASIVHRYGVDDSINASLQLYLDALNLFVCVLQLCEAAGAD